jgi:hypothetical protein
MRVGAAYQANRPNELGYLPDGNWRHLYKATRTTCVNVARRASMAVAAASPSGVFNAGVKGGRPGGAARGSRRPLGGAHPRRRRCARSGRRSDHPPRGVPGTACRSAGSSQPRQRSACRGARATPMVSAVLSGSSAPLRCIGPRDAVFEGRLPAVSRRQDCAARHEPDGTKPLCNPAVIPVHRQSQDRKLCDPGFRAGVPLSNSLVKSRFAGDSSERR